MTPTERGIIEDLKQDCHERLITFSALCTAAGYENWEVRGVLRYPGSERYKLVLCDLRETLDKIPPIRDRMSRLNEEIKRKRLTQYHLQKCLGMSSRSLRAYLQNRVVGYPGAREKALELIKFVESYYSPEMRRAG